MNSPKYVYRLFLKPVLREAPLDMRQEADIPAWLAHLAETTLSSCRKTATVLRQMQGLFSTISSCVVRVNCKEQALLNSPKI